MHPLTGPRLPFARSKEHVNRLREDIFGGFIESDPAPYEVVTEFDPKSGEGAFRVRVIKEPNVRWGIVIGEIGHNLRAALDGLAWQLALLEHTEPFPRTGFPIYILGRTKRKDRGGNLLPHFWGTRHGRRLLTDVPKRFWARIEAAQPYKRGNGGRLNPLFLVHEMNNTDKHKLLLVVGAGVVDARLAVREMGGEDGLHIKRIHRRIELIDGAEVITFRWLPRLEHWAVQMNPEIALQIEFGQSCEAVAGFPIFPTIVTIHNHVSDFVQSFGDVFG